MLANGYPFVFAKASGLAQDGIGHADLSHVMQQGTMLEVEPCAGPFRHAQFASECERELRDAQRMSVRLDVPRVERRDQSHDRFVVGVRELVAQAFDLNLLLA